jgi:hypothetical protein
MKVCKVCGIKKQENDFYPNDSTCKEDRKAKVRANRAANIDYYREYDKQRFKSNPERRKAVYDYQKTPKGKEVSKAAKIRWEKRNSIKKGAKTIVGNAVRDGRLFKPDNCEECGSKPKRLHGHHNDYAFALQVRWLCPGCHNKWHKENGEGKNG